MGQEAQIDQLNTWVKVRLAPSQIHGVGVFALRDIPKGAVVGLTSYPKAYNVRYANFTKLFPEVAQILIERWPGIARGAPFMYPDTNMQAYCNHSNDPNYDCLTDTACRDIKAGEEITEDYTLIPGWEEAHPWLVPPEEEKPKKKLDKRKRNAMIKS